MAFTTGLIALHSFGGDGSFNQVFSLYNSFYSSEVFEQALNDADIEMSDVAASMQINRSNASSELKQAHKVGKPTCLDFLDETKD